MKVLKLFVLASILMALAGVAMATTVSLQDVNVLLNPDNRYEYEFLAENTSNEISESGDYFVIYDFGPVNPLLASGTGPYTGGTIADGYEIPAGWDMFVNNIGPSVVNYSPNPPDNGRLNYSFVRTGASLAIGEDPGVFVLRSSFGPIPARFTSYGYTSATLQDDQLLEGSGGGITLAPNSPEIPEPASFVLAGAGLLALGLLRRRSA